MSRIHQGGIFFLCMIVGTVSGMDLSKSSISAQMSQLSSKLSTLESKVIRLQFQVEVLQKEKMEDKERFERRISMLESVCGDTEMEDEITGEQEVTTSTNGGSTSTELRPVIAIGGGGSPSNIHHSAEVLNTSCDFPLPEARWGHLSVNTLDGKTLVCGGIINRHEETASWNKETASCLQFDYESRSWKDHSTLQSIKINHRSAVTLSRGTYVLGGDCGVIRHYGVRVSNNDSSEFLATGSSVWTQGSRIPGYGVCESCVVKLSDTEFIVLGGRNDPTQARVYNEERDEWREWPRLTVEVIAYTCVRLGDIVLIAGGESYNPTRRTVIFDTKTGSAREVASLKYPRGWAAMDVIGGKAVILGGYDGSRRRSDGEMWNMDTETWEEADIHLNIARGTFSLATMAEDIDCD